MSELGGPGPERPADPEITVEQIRALELEAARLIVRPRDVAKSLGFGEPSHTWTTTYEGADWRVVIDIPEPGYDAPDREDETSVLYSQYLDIDHPANHTFTRSRTYKLSSEYGLASVHVRTHEFDADGVALRPQQQQGSSAAEALELGIEQARVEREFGLDRLHASDYRELHELLSGLSLDNQK